MRSAVIAVCVFAQALILAYMVFGREAVISNGTSISIATAPLDPRDPFRGDFVRLRYGLNSLAHAPTRWTPADAELRKGDKVYAVLQERPGGLHDVAYFTNVEPDSATGTLFLRGRLRTDNPGIGLNRVDVGYGIEQLFVEQGRGIDIEERQGVRGGLQTAMHARVSVSSDGTAVLTGYDWNALAIGIEIADDFALNRQSADDNEMDQVEADSPMTDTSDSITETMAETSAPSPKPSAPPLTLTISNVADQSVTLDNPGDDCGFHLEPVNRTTSRYMEPEGICADMGNVPVTLMPGESLTIAVDLASPRWHMSLNVEESIRTGDVRSFLDNGEWFRLVYRSAEPSDSADKDTSFWQGELISQAFNALGQID